MTASGLVFWMMASMLGTAFVVLKLCDVIDWSWVWVTIPFWGIFALRAIMTLLYYLVTNKEERKLDRIKRTLGA